MLPDLRSQIKTMWKTLKPQRGSQGREMEMAQSVGDVCVSGVSAARGPSTTSSQMLC